MSSFTQDDLEYLLDIRFERLTERPHSLKERIERGNWHSTRMSDIRPGLDWRDCYHMDERELREFLETEWAIANVTEASRAS